MRSVIDQLQDPIDPDFAHSVIVDTGTDQMAAGMMQDTLFDRLVAELVVYPGVGHTPRWQEPKRFADHIAGFLWRLP